MPEPESPRAHAGTARLDACPRCRGAHRLPYYPLTNPPPGWTHFTVCPVGGEPKEPILLQYPPPDLPQPPPPTPEVPIE